MNLTSISVKNALFYSTEHLYSNNSLHESSFYFREAFFQALMQLLDINLLHCDFFLNPSSACIYRFLIKMASKRRPAPKRRRPNRVPQETLNWALALLGPWWCNLCLFAEPQGHGVKRGTVHRLYWTLGQQLLVWISWTDRVGEWWEWLAAVYGRLRRPSFGCGKITARRFARCLERKLLDLRM